MWLIPILLLVGVLAFWMWLAFGGSGSTETTTTSMAPETTTTTVAETTTTAPATTTTVLVTTTTVPYPPPSAWPPVGDPIDQEDLTLEAAGVGDVEFGTALSEVAGIFTSSLGEAEASGDDDACDANTGYWLQWGPLRAIFDGYGDGSTFIAYRYEDNGGTADVELTTLSGLALGDTVEQLQDIYAAYTVTFEVIDGADHFRLSDGNELLLWGPVSSTDADGVVQGIYSPTLCQDS